MVSERPFVLTLHGADVVLAQKTSWLAKLVLRRARPVMCVSYDLAEAARRLGRMIRS